MESSPSPRARRSRHSRDTRRRFSIRPILASGLVIVLLGAAGCGVVKATGFMQGMLNLSSPLAEIQATVEPVRGSLPYKLKHGQQVNILMLGYGGAENDAPWLTDSMMVVSIDPATKRIAEISIPRDLMVQIDAFKKDQPVWQKINVAYTIGMDDATWPGKKPEYEGRDGAGRLAEHVVGAVTGLQFDHYVAVDFKAFRDTVDALGGVQVCLDTPLDDNQYPDYHDGYIKGGVHFSAGCQQVNGERALQLARSRHAVQPEQANDYGRARRQQLLVNGIRKKAVSVNGLTKAPQLMSALQKNFRSDLSPSDLKALYDWGGKLPDSSILRVGITEEDLVDRYYMRPGSCGGWYADVLCPEDPSFKMLKNYLGSVFVDRRVLAEAAPVEVDNASVSTEELGPRVSKALGQLGLKVSEPVRRRAAQSSVIYDYSGGKYPETARWLADYFGAPVLPPPATAAAGSSTGLVVVLGRDYALRWLGRA